MIVKLSGKMAQTEEQIGQQNEKRALLVYAGTFQSMDGEVVITPEHIELIAKNHNEKLEKLGMNVTMADLPPVQIDHSTSARDTVGRVVRELEVGMHGSVVALYGNIRIMGQDNWEKVCDGRWTNLSIGADLDKCTLDEVTITPFSAASGARFLSKKGVKMGKKKLAESEDNEEKKDKDKENETEEEEKKEEAKLSADSDADDKTKLAADGEKEKSEDEEKKEEKEDEKESEDSKQLKAKLSAFGEKSSKVRLALKTATVKARFARLRAEAKVTPAELKKINIAQLCAKNDATIDAVMATYESREPVIHVGQYGSVKAADASEIAKKAKLSQLEEETRARMSSIPKKTTRLSAEQTVAHTKPVEETVEMGEDSSWNEIVRLIEAGNHEEGRKLYGKMCKMSADNTPIGESDMCELMSSFADLESEHTEIVRLMGASSKVKL